jgi:hypothetical protein
MARNQHDDDVKVMRGHRQMMRMVFVGEDDDGAQKGEGLMAVGEEFSWSERGLRVTCVACVS